MSKQPTRFEALKKAISNAKTQSNFAKGIGISEARVSQLVTQSKQLPAEYVLKAEQLFGVSRHDLRPDIYPRPARQAMVDRGTDDRFYGVDQSQVAA